MNIVPCPSKLYTASSVFDCSNDGVPNPLGHTGRHSCTDTEIHLLIEWTDEDATKMLELYP